MKKSTLFLFLLLTASHWGFTQQMDTVEVTDLLNEIYFYDDDESVYLPLVDKDNYQGHTLHFSISSPHHSGLFLQLESKQKISVFVNNKLISNLKGPQVIDWPVDSLIKIHGSTLNFTLYNKRISPSNLNARLLSLVPSQKTKLLDEDVVIVSKRQAKNRFMDFLILVILIIGLLIAVLYHYYPKVYADFFQFKRSLAIRELDENLLKSRAFSIINILFYILYSLVLSFILICLLFLASFKFNIDFSSLWLVIWWWLKISGIILMGLIFKYLLLQNFSKLFNIKYFLPSHYFNFIRIGFLVFLILSFGIVFSYLVFEITSLDYYHAIFIVLLIGIALRALVLMLKLMSTASYKFLHLFSYLCATELIPLGIIMFLGFNQSI